jgi:hypothetical protein
MRPPERELELNFPYTKCRRNIDNSDWIQLRLSVKTPELKGFVHREQIKDLSSLNFERVQHKLAYSGMASVYYVSDDSGVDLDIGKTLSSSDLTIVILNPNIGDNFIVGIGDRNLLCDGEFAPSYFFTTPNDLRIPTSNLSDVNNQSQEDLAAILGTVRKNNNRLYNMIVGLVQQVLFANEEMKEEKFQMLLPKLLALLARRPKLSKRLEQLLGDYEGVEQFIKEWEECFSPTPAFPVISGLDSSLLRSQGNEFDQVLDLLKPQHDPRS